MGKTFRISQSCSHDRRNKQRHSELKRNNWRIYVEQCKNGNFSQFKLSATNRIFIFIFCTEINSADSSVMVQNITLEKVFNVSDLYEHTSAVGMVWFAEHATKWSYDSHTVSFCQKICPSYNYSLQQYSKMKSKLNFHVNSLIQLIWYVVAYNSWTFACYEKPRISLIAPISY